MGKGAGHKEGRYGEREALAPLVVAGPVTTHRSVHTHDIHSPLDQVYRSPRERLGLRVKKLRRVKEQQVRKGGKSLNRVIGQAGKGENRHNGGTSKDEREHAGRVRGEGKSGSSGQE